MNITPAGMACYKNRVGDGGSPDPERWEGRLNHSFRLNRESAANKTESGTAAAPARDGGKDGSTIRLG